jgi:hypothetical protein
LVSRITARNPEADQIRGKSFPSKPPNANQGITMLDHIVTISARLTLLSLFVLMLALAGAGA